MPIGQPTIHFDQVTSTNDIAWTHTGEESNHGLMVVADEQTAGRGRRGDIWVSPSGSALYLSIVLHPAKFIRRPVMLTIWAALGVCRVIEKSLSIQPRLKWPNDVLIEGKKVCGILVEQRNEWFVVGIGLNINVAVQKLQLSGVHHAGSLQEFTNQRLTRTELLHALQTEWDELYTLLNSQKTEPLLKYWMYYSGMIGQIVKLESHGLSYTGILHTLRWEEITIVCEGKLHSFQPESVTKLAFV